MPRGRKPQGDQALSNAQRQARYRARRAVAKPLPAIPFHRRIRPPSRPQRWHAAVALRAIVELDLDELAVIDPPRGYARD